MYTSNHPQTSSPDEDPLYSVENIAIHIQKKNKQTNKQTNSRIRQTITLQYNVLKADLFYDTLHLH